MLSKKYLNEADRIKANNSLFKLVVMVIGIAVLYNSVMLHKALNTQRIILVPSVISAKMMISGDNADDNYFRAITRDITNLAFNFTPATARSQFSDIVAMYEPDSYALARAKWYDLADTVETAKQVSSVFYVQKISVDNKNNTIEVTGIKKQYADAKEIENTVKTYVIEYEIKDGKFWLKGRGLYEKEK